MRLKVFAPIGEERAYRITCNSHCRCAALLASLTFQSTHIMHYSSTPIMANTLRKTCQRIDFAALRGPKTAELDDLYGERNNGHIYGSKADDGTSRIRLGSLDRPRNNAVLCKLCALICHIIERQGAIGPSGKRLDPSAICFVATAGAVSSYYGSTGTVVPPQRVWLWRLSGVPSACASSTSSKLRRSTSAQVILSGQRDRGDEALRSTISLVTDRP